MHYSKNIDTMNLGRDFDGDQMFSLPPNAQSKGLFMLLQSLPETHHKVDVTSDFVNRAKYFAGEKPERIVHDGSGTIITITPTPYETPEIQSRIAEEVYKALDPAKHAEMLATRAALQQQLEDLRTAHETLGKEVYGTPGVRDKAKIEAYGVASDRYHHDSGLLQNKLYTTDFVEQLNYYRPFDEHLANSTRAKIQRDWYKNACKPFVALLEGAGIAYRIHGNNRIEIDQAQPDFDNKLCALMDAHRAEISAHYNDADFIITKPDGSVLDKEQAATVIAGRRAALEEDAAHINAAAEKYGVSKMVAAKLSPRTGRSLSRGDDAASSD